MSGVRIKSYFEEKKMSFLATVISIAMLAWFYFTAQKYKAPSIQWAIIGFIGYWIVWGLAYLLVIKGLIPSSLARTSMILFVIAQQIPAACAVLVAYLVRGKLIADAVKNPPVTE
jgi:predicted neutral ceramidase superfamily lipid hydrolase